MKLKFDSTLDYQQEAIAAVRDVFKGQTVKPSLFTVTAVDEQLSLLDEFSAPQQLALGQGIGNRLGLDQEDLLKNIREVQLRHGLPQSDTLESELNLDIEMETGTGKTYVYLRTLLELNKAYGFTKFIIVVPSIAIKEGVKKTIDITREHFRGIYTNVNYDAFVYDSNHIEKIRDFATANDIQIMVITIDAFQKSSAARHISKPWAMAQPSCRWMILESLYRAFEKRHPKRDAVPIHTITHSGLMRLTASERGGMICFLRDMTPGR